SRSGFAAGVVAATVRFGHVPGTVPRTWPAETVLEQLDLVAHGDFARLDDPGEHSTLVVELRAQALAQVVHALARVADHRDLEDRLADTDALPDRPALDVGAVDGQVLADRPRFDADGLEVLHRREQHLAPRRIRVRAA